MQSKEYWTGVDRIGSDEIHELNEIVRFINRSAIKNK